MQFRPKTTVYTKIEVNIQIQFKIELFYPIQLNKTIKDHEMKEILCSFCRISAVPSFREKCSKLFDVDLTTAVTDFSEHLINFGVCQLLTNGGQNVLQLGG